MPQINFEDAIHAITQIAENATRNDRFQLFFLVGAGISAPYIPLASQITDECKERIKNATLPSGYDSWNSMVKYSYWLSKAFPTPEQRQDLYFKPMIQNAYISNANYRLAHLLLSRKISDLVVTPNFDDCLTKALLLFGENPVISDHPKTFHRLSLRDGDIKVMHVHGTYKFYDCCNLENEILQQGTSPVLNFLQNVFDSRSAIVIGYSGWEDDPIMRSLRLHITSNENYRHNIYWFCYTYNDFLLLPEWLKNNHQVHFIVPPNRSDNDQPVFLFRMNENEEGKVTIRYDEKPIIANAADVIYYDVNNNPIQIEDATEESFPSIVKTTEDKLPEELQKILKPYYIEYEERFKLPAEKVFDALIEKLQPEVPLLLTNPIEHLLQQLKIIDIDSESKNNDIYSFTRLKEQISYIQQLLCENPFILSDVEAALQDIDNFIRQSQYEQVISLIQKIIGVSSVVSRLDYNSLLKVFAAAIIVADRCEGKDEVISSCRSIIQIARILNDRFNHKKTEAHVIRSHYRIGIILMEHRQFRMAVDEWDTLVKVIGDISLTPKLIEYIIVALVNQVLALKEVGNIERVNEIYHQYEKCYDMFSTVMNEKFNYYLSGLSIIYKIYGDLLVRKGDAYKAYEMYSKVINGDRHNQASIYLMAEVKIECIKINYMLKSDSNVYNQIVNFCEYLIQQIPIIGTQKVAIHLNNAAFNLILFAKSEWQKENEREAKKIIEDLQLLLDKSLELSIVDITLGNKAYTLFLLGRDKESYDVLMSAYQKGGSDLLQAEIKDATTNQLPIDDSFIALINKILANPVNNL